jgi:hypothetical protein
VGEWERIEARIKGLTPAIDGAVARRRERNTNALAAERAAKAAPKQEVCCIYIRYINRHL